LFDGGGFDGVNAFDDDVVVVVVVFEAAVLVAVIVAVLVGFVVLVFATAVAHGSRSCN